MREQVLIEQRSLQQDAAGEPVETWQFVALQRAEIERTTGHEAWASQQRLGRVPTIFHLRFVDGIKPQMRLTNAGKVYDIVSAIDPDGGGAELIIMCLELLEQATVDS